MCYSGLHAHLSWCQYFYYEGYGEERKTSNNSNFACLSFLELNFPKVIPQKQLSSKKKNMILKIPDNVDLSAYILSSTLYWNLPMEKIVSFPGISKNMVSRKESQYYFLQKNKVLI